MKGCLRFLVTIDDAIVKVEDVIVWMLHGLIAAMVMFSVLLRYVFNSPLTWGEELIVAMLTWMVFIGAAAAVRSQMHIRIDALAPIFRMAKFNWLNTVTVLAGAVILVTAISGSVDQVLDEYMIETPMMGVSKAFFSAAMPCGLTLLLLHVIRIWMEVGAAPVFRDETEALVIKEGEWK